MKRDIDIVRAILLEVEKQGGGAEVETMSLPYPLEEVLYNADIMRDAGLIDAVPLHGSDGSLKMLFIKRMTWDGHDFLDASRDETVWQKAKEKVLKPAGSWTFAVLAEWLKSEVKARLGMPG